MKTSIITVTPAIAAELLERNCKNRHMSIGRVRQMSELMKAGKWDFNGDSIRLSKTGVLLDGQHRLSAVVMSGVSANWVLVEGLDDSVFTSIDMGGKRSPADILDICGYKNSTHLAAAVGLCIHYERKDVLRKGKIEATEILEYVRAHPDIEESVPYAQVKALMPPSLGITAHFVFKQINGPDAGRFMSQVMTGEGITSKDPALKLRNRLISQRASLTSIPKEVMFALTIKAWNAFRKGVPLTTLRFITDGPSAEEFPVAR